MVPARTHADPPLVRGDRSGDKTGLGRTITKLSFVVASPSPERSVGGQRQCMSVAYIISISPRADADPPYAPSNRNGFQSGQYCANPQLITIVTSPTPKTAVGL